jgi:hypothetical protein
MPSVAMVAPSSFFDVIVISCPDAIAARACISGTLQDLVRYLNNGNTSTTRTTTRTITTNSRSCDDEDHALGGESWLMTDDGRTILGATCDPNGQKCGSGGGTIACYEYAQKLYAIMASRGTTTTSSASGVANIRVLIIHGGGHSSRCPSQMVLGKAWTTLLTYKNTSSSSSSSSSYPQIELTSPALKILQLMQKLFFSSLSLKNKHCGSYLPPGSVVVSSGDALITLNTATSEGQHDDALSHLHEQLLQYWHPQQKQLQQQQQLQLDLNAVIGLAVPALPSVATNHGVFIIHDTVNTPTTNASLSISPVVQYLQKPPLQDLNGITTAWIDTGIVIFLPQAARILQQLGGLLNTSSTHVPQLPPLLSYCTRNGFTTNTTQTSTAIPVDLYSHIMPALATINTCTTTTTQGCNYQNLQKYLSLVGCSSGESKTTRDLLLSELYGIFHTLPFHVITCPKGQFTHLGTTRELVTFFTTNTSVYPEHLPLGRPRRAISFLNPKHTAVTIDPSTVTINVLFSTIKHAQENDSAINIPPTATITIGSHCVLEHCHLHTSHRQTFQIGNDCLLSGIKAEFYSSKMSATSSHSYFTIASGMMVQQVPLKTSWRRFCDSTLGSEEKEEEEDFAIVALHVDDPIQTLTNSIYGIDLQQFLSWTGNALTEADIWPRDRKDGDVPRTIWHAKIHPVVSRKRHTQPSLKVNFSAVIGWLSQLMNRHQQREEIVHEDEDYNLLQHNIKAWKDMERLSLSEICQLADACAEYTSRENLTVKIKSAYEETVDDIYQNVQLRSSLLPNNTAPFIESFVGGDIFPFEVLYHRLLHCSKDKGNSQPGGNEQSRYDYDYLSRSFMVLAGTLSDAAEKLQTLYEPTMDRNDKEFTLFEGPPCSSALRTSMEQIIERIRTSYYHYPPQLDVVEEACISIRAVLFQFLSDGLRCQQTCDLLKVLTICTNYLELCASALTEVCICASSEISVKRITSPAPLNQWVLATSAGRVDIAGGFSDLPPIFYEHGGSVVGFAVAVDGVKPLSARCRRRHEGDGLHLVSEARSLEDGSLLYRFETHVTTIQDLMDYRDLNSGACLLKASVLCLEIIPLSAIHGDVETLRKPIQPYLDSFFGLSENEDGGMIELVSTSLLPRGSGMGSSSLLGACVLSAICRCAGVKLICTRHGSDANNLSDEETMTHTVLALEQIMHSGGGYQVSIIIDVLLYLNVEKFIHLNFFWFMPWKF